jgi:hypothetical protein
VLIGWTQEPFKPLWYFRGSARSPAWSPCGVSVGWEASSVATSKAEEYRAKAREAEQLAERTNDSVIKEQALKIAEQWQYMADYEEKRWGR